MKKITILLSTLALALAAVSCAGGGAANTCPKSESESCSATTCKIAYLNVEQVMATSELFKQEGVKLQERTEKARSEWARKEQAFQQELVKLQEKYQKGLITSANAQKEQQAIEQRVAAYQRTTQSEAQALDEENSVFANRMQDIMRRSVEAINGDKKYKMILNANILIDADTTLNITPIVLEKFNALSCEDK